MNPPQPGSPDVVATVLSHVSHKGVRLWVEDGQLRYRALKGALTPEEIRVLRQSKNEIVATLQSTVPPTDAASRGTDLRLEEAPMTFSQLAHWNSYRLRERPSVRQIASATTLRGRLNIEALNTGFAENARRHDALRTRIVVRNNEPIQQISASSDFRLRQIDLSTLPADLHQAEVRRLISKEIMEPVDVCSDPLFAASLVRLADEEHVLIVVMEHLISDAISMNLFIRDLFAIYGQTMRGEPILLPELPVQFSDYARWQKVTQDAWQATHGAYWKDHLKGFGRLRFPLDQRLSSADRSGWGTVPIVIDRPLKAALLEWCRARKTTLVMMVFTAFAIIVLRWCKASEGILQYQSDGRFNPKLEHSIGYYASPLYLKASLRKDDTFLDAIERVTAEYITAYQHADSGFMESREPRADFTRNSCFNWVPRDAGDLTCVPRCPDEISCVPVTFEHPMLRTLERDTEPVVLLFDSPEEVIGDVCFPLGRFSVPTMQEFADSLLQLLRAALTEADAPVARFSAA